MKLIFCILLSLFQTAYAADGSDAHKGHKGHEGHTEELTSVPRLTETSVLQLDSTWKNQKNESVKLSALQGKPRLLVMLFTKCETACPLIVEDTKQIMRELDSKKIDVSFFSFDSFRETPETLLDFAKKRKLPADWTLFTADANAVAELAAALGIRYKRLPSGDFIHSNVIFFLNKDGEVVAQKEGLKSPSADFIKKIKQTIKGSK